MADISLLFDVAGGGSLSGESGKRIQEQLTAIVDKINSDPLKIKIVADDKSIEDLRKKIDELKKAVGSDGIIKIESSDLNGMAKTLNQISTALQHMMIAVGKNGAQLGKFSDQLQNIFEAIPENSNLTTKQIKSITDSFAELVDKVEELNVTVDQINGKKFGATINIAGGVQESAEQIEAYRKYLLALLRDFAELQSSYRHLMGESNNPKMANMAYAASAAVNGNRKLYDAIQNFNFGDMKAQAGLMDFEQLKEAVGLYKSLIASMINIRYKGNEIFSAGDQTAVNAALQQIREVESSMDNLGEAPAGGAGEGGSIFDFIDKVREGIEALQDPLSAVRKVIDETFTFGEIPEDRRTAMVESVTALSNEVSQVFTDLRVKITETFDFSSLSEDGRKEYIESIRSECLQIESFFDQLREKILATFDLSDVDTSSISGIIERIQTEFNNLTLDLGNINITGTIGRAVEEQSGNFVRETRPLKDLIPNTVKIADSISSDTLDKLSDVMQGMRIAEGDAGSLANLFKDLSGTVTEVTTKIVDQGRETEYLKNVTIKGVDEMGQAFSRSADYVLKHSKKNGDYFEDHTTTIRKQIIAEQERTKAVKESADARTEAANEEIESEEKLTRAQERAWEERNRHLSEQAESEDEIERAYAQYAEQLERAERAEEKLARTQTESFEKSQETADRARDRAEEEANSIERRNKLLTESNNLIAKIQNMSAREGVTDEQSGQFGGIVNAIHAYQDAVTEGRRTNEDFAEWLNGVKLRMSELGAEFSAAEAPIKMLKEGTSEYADALKNIQTTIGNAQNALTNFSAAEKSSNESSRTAYQNIGNQIQKLRELEAAVRAGSISEKDFKTRLSDINTEIKENSNVIRENGDAHKSLGEGIAKTIKNFSQWLGVSRILMGAIRTIKQMVSAVIELDTAMTELRKVTDETEARYDKFLEDAGVRAKQVGASLRDTVSATADFARLGYSVDQAEKLADAAIIYKNVGDGISDITEASESIIATMQAFAVKPEDVMSIVDKFNDVGNKFAISSGGVGEALLRSAAAMQAANNTLDETIALATAANKIVQNPQIVGTSLKTISMYLRAAKTEAEEAGEETEGMAESVSKLRSEILRLTGNRVDIQIDENTFKSTYQILKDLSEVWSDLSDVSQANIQALVGGKRNANVVAALLTNFSEAEKALQVSIDSMNSATEENEKVLASIQGRINKFKASFEVLSSTIVDGDLVKFVVDSGTWLLDLINGISRLFDALGGLKTILIGFSPVIISLISGSGMLSTVLTGIKTLLIGMISPIGNAVTAWKAYASGIVSLGTAMQASLGIISIALTAIVAVYSKVKQAEQERRSAAALAAQTASEQGKEIAELVRRYDELSDAAQTDDTAKQDLKEITDKLVDSLGVEEGAVKRLAGRYGSLTEAIKEASIAKLREQRRDLQTDYNQSRDDLIEAAKPTALDDSLSFINTNGSVSYSEKAALDYFKNQGLIRGNIIYGVRGRNGYSKATFAPNVDLSSAEGVLDAYEKYGKMLDELDARGITDGALRDSIAAGYGKLSEAVEKSVTATERLNTNLLDLYYSEHLLGKAVPETVDEFEALRNETIEQIGAQNRFIGSSEELETAVDDMLKSSERFSKFYSEVSTSVGQASGELDQSVSDFNEYKRAIGDLGRALGEFQEQGSVSAETYRELADGNEKYQELFKVTDNGIELQTDKLNSYVESLEQEYGAKMALSGATDEEIRMMVALGNTLITVSKDTGDVVSEITELRGYVDDLNRGVEYSWDEIVRLTKKYPKLEEAIVDTEHGYRLEIDAIEDLIAIKAEYIRLTDRELAVVQARNALNLKNSGNTTATVKIDEVFKKYEEMNGRAITSLEEFKEAYILVFGKVFEGAYEEYENYVEALISENKGLELAAKLSMNALEDTAEGLDPDKIEDVADAVEDAAKEINDIKSDLDDLTGVVKKMNEGTELSTSEIITLLMKYPALRDHIIKTANGYKIETSAIKDLIAAKVQLITTTDKERRVEAARDSLVSKAKGTNTRADNTDIVFADYLSKNGRNIQTLEEYKEAYRAYYGYAAKASLEYAQAKIDALNNAGEDVFDPVVASIFNDYLDDNYMEGYTPDKSSSSETEKDVETEFERMYKLHQHYLAMDKETEEQYLSWLEGAYKASYASGEMELDDYYKYEEEVYEKRKELFSRSLDETQHQIGLLSHQMGDTSQEQIALYEQMQKSVNQKANEYRSKGVKENNELIRELQNQWWQYEENIRQLRENAFNDWLNDKKFLIDQLKQDGASSDEIVNSWREVLTRINDEIAYYLSKGYDITSDVIQNLMGELKDAKDSISAALEELVTKANEVVDGFQNVYTTLTNAAKEYASTGYLSVDSLQSILELGPKYMDMLYDESGQLTINEEALQKVIAARTEEMAAETALSYAKQVLLATEGNESQKLKELTDVQAASSSATWDMAYATLGYAKALGATKGISDEYYEKAIQYVTRMQSVTKTATDSISAYYKTLDEGYVSQADGLETILKLTEDMLKQENSDRIKQLEDEKDAYKDIIDQKKEILRLTKEQQDHDRDMADKLKEISDLQSKIDQLALDDSREARAQRSKLEEQLLEKQKALTDSQNDYAIDAQEEALDKQYEEYEKGLDKQTDALKEELNSAEKLYQAAIDRISNGWDTLYDDLLNWNYNYGSTLQKDLVNAWEAAKTAAERYGDFVSAMEGVKEHNKLGEASYTPSTESVRNAVASGASTLTNYIDRMRANSLAWFTAEDQGYYEQDNRNAAAEYKAATGNTLSYKNGSWYQNGSSSPIYTLSRDEVGNAVVAAMRANSAAWKNASGSEQKDLERMNEKLAKRLSDFLGVPITKTPGGVWMLGTTPLYEVTKFHTGGIVGGSGSLRQNEVMALLKKGETVLDEKREQALYKTVDFVQVLSDKIGRAIDKGKLSSLLSGTSQTVTKNLVPALAGGGIGTMNFSPTISVTIAGAGDLNESTARKYGTIAANTALEQLKSAFTQRGVSAAGNSILK